MSFNQSNGGAAALEYVESVLMGRPYVFGGNYPPLGTSPGTDCSGTVQLAYNHVGVTLPRTTYTQYLHYQIALKTAKQPGDCLFFRGSDPGPNGEPGHVGLYVGIGAISTDQHTFMPNARGAIVMYDAPWTGDPHGIRYDLVDPATVLFVTRPALALSPAPAPIIITEDDQMFLVQNPHDQGWCLLHGDRWSGVINPDAKAALLAQGIKTITLTVAQFDTLVQVPWGQA